MNLNFKFLKVGANRALMDSFFRKACIFIFTCLSFIFTPSVSAGDNVSIQLKWFHQFQFAGYYAAQKQGYYQELGLNVEIRELTENNEPMNSVVSGKSEFGIADASLVKSKLMGQPVVVMAAIFQETPFAIMALSSSNIVSPLDLIGKRVMYRRKGDDAVITAMLAELGISEEDYTHIPHTFDDNALLNGSAEAMSVYITDQPFYYQQRDISVNLLKPVSYGIDVYGDLLFTSKEYLINHPEQALAFREASIKGWQYALDHPEEIIDWMLENLNISKTKEQLQYEAELTKRMIKPNLIEVGTLNKKRFQRIAQIYQLRQKSTQAGNLDNFLYNEVISPNVDYKKITYISWLILAVLLLVAFTFFAINKRLKILVEERTQELEASKRALDLLVSTDELTGVGNRRKLNQFFDEELKKAHRYLRPLSLVLIDIDHFKQINDKHGHACGDLVLKEFSKLLVNNIRASDIVGRWGGEEFLIICPETQLHGALQLAEHLRLAIESAQFTQGLAITSSFGVSDWHEGESGETLFGRCDRALYKAKDSGRNCVKSW